MTVYYQFGSKAGLLEALSDDLAARAGIGARLAAAFAEPDAVDAPAVLDPEIERGERARNERRRTAIRGVLGRLAEQRGRPGPATMDEVVDLLHVLTSFETFDALAGADRTPEEVVPLVQWLALAAVELDDR